MTLKVIGAGFGRTGTDSLREALDLLGFGPCHHMHIVLAEQDRVDSWRAVTQGQAPDWDQLFAGFRATVDWPAAYFWREISAHFPNAKIVLSLRDPDQWYASMDKTILEVVRNSTDPESFATRLLGKMVFGDQFNDREHVIDVYNQNTRDVQAAFGPDRLLTYQTGDGWEPLCEFLGCDIPDEPYPHRNKPGSFHTTLDKLESGRDTSDAD